MSNRKTLIKQGAWFFFFNSILLLIIATRYFRYFIDINNLFTVFYLVIATISHFVTLSFLLLILYIPLIIVYPRKTFAILWATTISSLTSLILLLDTFVFDLYRMHINKFVFELLFGGAGSQIFQFHIKQYILCSVIILFFLFSIFLIARWFFNFEAIKYLRKGWLIAISIAIMMLSAHIIHAWADASNYTSITKSSRYYPLYFPTQDRKLMFKLGVVNKTDKLENIDFSLKADNKDLNYPKHSIICDTTVKTNIIFILIDAWYYKSLDSATMPNIFTFSKQCDIYKNHYSGSNGTRTGLFSLFYSIPGIYWDMVLASQIGPIFNNVLLKNNYTIETFPSASLTSPPFDRTIFRKIKNLKTDTKGKTVCDRDIQITQDWLQQTRKHNLESVNNPVFSFIFYDELHAICHPANFKGPFQPEWEYPKYELLKNDLDAKPFLNLYKNSAYFVDSLVGKVLKDLKEKGMLKNSWVVITGDHGQEFNDNKKNYWGHNGNYSAAQMQVPLLIYKPGNMKPKTYSHWTSHYDIVPTIFTELFHCKNPYSDYSIGKNLNDTTIRNWLIVGSSDNFGILQPDRINSVYFNGSYDITDRNLNPINNSGLQTKQINDIIKVSKSFFP